MTTEKPGAYVPDSTKPPWKDVTDLLATPIPKPPALVEGMIRRGEKAVIGGSSKSMKSWATLDLAVSVATGSPWLGRETSKGVVLVLDLELPEYAERERFDAIMRAKSVTIDRDSLLVWNLRGHRMTPAEILATVEGFAPGDLALLIVDPAYKLFTGKDENSAADISNFLGQFDPLMAKLGTTVVIPSHFAKGNAADKESIDRIAGSGVYARDPDTIMTLTKHETDGAFTVDTTLRTFAPVDPFVIRWEFPLFRADNTLDPTKLKRPAGRSRKYDDDGVLGLLAIGKLSYAAWQKAAEEKLGMPKRTFDDYRQRFLDQKRVIRSSTDDAYYLPSR